MAHGQRCPTTPNLAVSHLATSQGKQQPLGGLHSPETYLIFGQLCKTTRETRSYLKASTQKPHDKQHDALRAGIQISCQAPLHQRWADPTKTPLAHKLGNIGAPALQLPWESHPQRHLSRGAYSSLRTHPPHPVDVRESFLQSAILAGRTLGKSTPGRTFGIVEPVAQLNAGKAGPEGARCSLGT